MRVKVGGSVDDDGCEWELVRGGGRKGEVGMETKVEGDGLAEGLAGLGLGGGDGNGDGDGHDDKKKVVKEKEDVPDPLRQFGILVPRALRTAQSEFESAVQVMVQVLEVQIELQRMEGIIEDHRRKMVKKD